MFTEGAKITFYGFRKHKNFKLMDRSISPLSRWSNFQIKFSSNIPYGVLRRHQLGPHFKYFETHLLHEGSADLNIALFRGRVFFKMWRVWTQHDDVHPYFGWEFPEWLKENYQERWTEDTDLWHGHLGHPTSTSYISSSVVACSLGSTAQVCWKWGIRRYPTQSNATHSVGT